MNYEEFYESIKQVIEDQRLYPFEQVVIIANILYQGDWAKVLDAFPQQPVQAMNRVRREAIRDRWIVEQKEQ